MTLKVTQGQLSIDIGCPRPNSTANLPHVADAAGRRDTDGRTDGRTLDCFKTLAGYCA